MRLIVCSDVHAHPWAAYSKPTTWRGHRGVNSRLALTLDALDESLAEAREYGATWICAGDIVHTAGLVQNKVLNYLIEVLNGYPDVMKLAVWGNHDSRGKGRDPVTASETAMHALQQAVTKFRMLDNETWSPSPDGLRIYGSGAQPHWSQVQMPPAFVDVMILHGTINQSRLPTGFLLESSMGPKALLEHTNLVIAGDVHHPDLVDFGRKAVLIPGSLEHHNFGDEGPHGYWDLNLDKHDDGTWYITSFDQAQMTPSQSPMFVTVDSVSEIDQDDGNYYRVLNPGEELPDGVTGVTSPATAVEHRDIIEAGSTVRDILTAWVRENPPSFDIEEEVLVKMGLQVLPSMELNNQLRDLKLKRIAAVDFFSYKTLDQAFADGMTLVVGASADFDSNGAGKSTLFEALYWALFGKTTKGTRAEHVIRWDQPSTRVWVHLENDAGEEVVITRSRTASGTHELAATVNDESLLNASSVREATKQLEAWLGIDPETFRVLAYYSQEDALLFNRLTDGERKDCLSAMCGLTAYQQGSELAKERLKRIAADAVQAESKVSALQPIVERQQHALTNLKDQSAEWKRNRRHAMAKLKPEVHTLKISSLVKDTETEMAQAESAFEEEVNAFARRMNATLADAIKERRTVLLKQQQAINDPTPPSSEVGELARRLTIATKQLETNQRVIGAVEAEHNKTQAILLPLRAEVENLIKRREHFVGLTKTDERSVCPECEQVITSSFIAVRLEGCNDELKALSVELKQTASKESLQRTELTNLRNQIRELQDINARARDANHKLELHEKEVERIALMRKQAEERLDETAKREAETVIERKIDDHTAEKAVEIDRFLKERQGRIEEHKRKLRKASATLDEWKNKRDPNIPLIAQVKEENEKTLEEMGEAKTLIAEAIVNKARWNYWVQGLSKRGIQSLLLEEIANHFNSIRAEIFPLLTGGVIDVQFSTLSTTASGETREKTDFLITYNGREIPYANLSGGQRRRVDVGAMLSLALANSRQRGAQGVFGLLVFDELFDHLDGSGGEALVDVLDQVVAKEIPSVYVVSQNDGFQSLFPQVVEVEQGMDGVSRIVS